MKAIRDNNIRYEEKDNRSVVFIKDSTGAIVYEISSMINTDSTGITFINDYQNRDSGSWGKSVAKQIYATPESTGYKGHWPE
jgi:hypothetical protein